MTRRPPARPLASAALAVVVLAATGCYDYGFRSRERARSASPDGRLVAICQEIPVFDGPDIGIRLEATDGRLVRTLLRINKAHPCDELVWSPDGRTLAVLIAYQAAAVVLDVDAALREPGRRAPAMYVDLATGQDTLARHLRFTAPGEVAFDACRRSSLAARRRNGDWSCDSPSELRRVTLDAPPEGRRWRLDR